MSRFVSRLVALAALLALPSLAAAQRRAAIAQVNEAIVFDLFLNYELTEKNGNNSTLIDYVPRAPKTPLERVEMTSNYGGENERTTFTYGERGRLSRVEYRRDDKVYVYEVSYDGDRPSGMTIAAMPRIRFGYRNDTLVTITRERAGGTLEYTINHVAGEQRAELALVVVPANGKRSPSPSKYWVTWDDRARLTGYELGTYVGRDITRTEGGDVATFTYYTHDDEKRTATWDYVVDAKRSWTERRFGKLVVRRTIEYASR
jgi:hypothetical protein